MIETTLTVPAERQRELFGQFDQYVKKIERALQVTVLSRDGEIRILGSPTNALRAKKIFESLDTLAVHGTPITDKMWIIQFLCLMKKSRMQSSISTVTVSVTQ